MIIAAVVDGPSRDEVRRVATETFSGREFLRTKSIWQRIVEWISDHLHFSPGVGGQFTAMSQLVSWLIVIGAVAALVAVLVLVIRRWTPRARSDDDELEVEILDERTTAQWRADARRLEEEGRWKDALRARYRELVGELIDRSILDPRPGRTTGEFRDDVASAAPQVAESFDEASWLFEFAWYADGTTGRPENEQFSHLAADVLDRAKTPVRVGADAS
jgi:hypothetical protein